MIGGKQQCLQCYNCWMGVLRLSWLENEQIKRVKEDTFFIVVFKMGNSIFNIIIAIVITCGGQGRCVDIVQVRRVRNNTWARFWVILNTTTMSMAVGHFRFNWYQPNRRRSLCTGSIDIILKKLKSSWELYYIHHTGWVRFLSVAYLLFFKWNKYHPVRLYFFSPIFLLYFIFT